MLQRYENDKYRMFTKCLKRHKTLSLPNPGQQATEEFQVLKTPILMLFVKN
jgi:hypothetical protein